MTALETLIREIKERAEKATPGPWTDHDNHGVRYVSNGMDGRFAKFDNRICEAALNLHHPPVQPNLRFIAHARQDIPLLLKIIEVQAAALEALASEHYVKAHNANADVIKLIQEARAK